MTIDEAIAHEKNIVDNKKKYAEIHCVTQEFYTDIDYHEQLAEWLEELKQYKETEEQELLVKVECHCKDCVHWSNMCTGCTDSIKLCTVGGYMVGENGYCVYAEKKI